MVRGRIEEARLQVGKAWVSVGVVAPGTERVAFGQGAESVRLMAICAAHARRVHFALQERSIDIDLVKDLPVRMIQSLAQERRNEVVEKGAAGSAAFRDQRLPSRVTRGADLDFQPWSGRVEVNS